MADDLIDRLTRDLRPTNRMALPKQLFGWASIGGIGAAVLMLVWLGLRPDMESATGNMMFWSKFAFTTAFAVLGGLAALNLSRPGGSMARAIWWIAGLVALMGILGIGQMLIMGPSEMRRLTIGSSALLCPFYIVALSAPIYAATILAMRRAAPTNPTLAGFAAGLLAGGAATWIYAFHCTESGMPFVAIWYTLGVLVTAGLGALIGRFALRW